ncbi:MAG: helicase, partial [Sphingomonas sp.]|nr:helicase [Sphingomonas sp.]
PAHDALRAAPEAIDLAVLKRLAEEPGVRDRARSAAMVARLWAACGVPDFRKLGIDPHTRFVARLFGHLSEGNGYIPHDWFAAEIARLDVVTGDVETIAGRIAAARSWAYIAHRADWLADPAHWAERTLAIEERLSDALHDRLKQRFVDRRTTVLMRRIGADPLAIPVTIDADGAVLVEDQAIGRLEGFRFVPDCGARAADKRMLIAAAEKRLSGVRQALGEALASADDAAIGLDLAIGGAAQIVWQGRAVGALRAGAALTRPRVELDRALDCLDAGLKSRVRQRIEAWTTAQVVRHIPGLVAVEAIAGDPAASAPLRVIAAALVGGAGVAARLPLGEAIDALSAEDRRRLRAAGITIGALDLFDARMFKAGPARWRQALGAVRRGAVMPQSPPTSATVAPRGTPGVDQASGYRTIGAQSVRVDLVERIARAAHDHRQGRTPFAPDAALAVSIGITPATLARLMVQLGFRPAPPLDGVARWVWRGRAPVARPAMPVRDNAFSALAGLALRHG